MPHPEPGRPGSPPGRRNLTSMILPARRRSPPSANASHRHRHLCRRFPQGGQATCRTQRPAHRFSSTQTSPGSPSAVIVMVSPTAVGHGQRARDDGGSGNSAGGASFSLLRTRRWRHIRRSSYLCWAGDPVPARSVAGYERLGVPGDGRLIQGGVVIVLISDAGDRLAARSDVNVALGELLAGRQGVRRSALAGRKVA